MIFITATDTGVGKTYFSQKILTEACRYFERNDIAYYKPVQCGSDYQELFGNELLETDFQTIERTCPEIDTYYDYHFNYPASPDFAASLENREIDLKKIAQTMAKLKEQYKFVVVEGAGGLMVPLAKYDTILDLILTLALPTVLITKSSLGTINQSILSLQKMKQVGVNIKGFIAAQPKEKEKEELAKANPQVNELYDEQIQESFESIQRFTKIPQIEVFDLFEGMQPLDSASLEKQFRGSCIR